MLGAACRVLRLGAGGGREGGELGEWEGIRSNRHWWERRRKGERGGGGKGEGTVVMTLAGGVRGPWTRLTRASFGRAYQYVRQHDPWPTCQRVSVCFAAAWIWPSAFGEG